MPNWPSTPPDFWPSYAAWPPTKPDYILDEDWDVEPPAWWPSWWYHDYHGIYETAPWPPIPFKPDPPAHWPAHAPWPPKKPPHINSISWGLWNIYHEQNWVQDPPLPWPDDPPAHWPEFAIWPPQHYLYEEYQPAPPGVTEWPPVPEWTSERPPHWPASREWPPKPPADWPKHIYWTQYKPTQWPSNWPWPPTETPTTWPAEKPDYWVDGVDYPPTAPPSPEWGSHWGPLPPDWVFGAVVPWPTNPPDDWPSYGTWPPERGDVALQFYGANVTPNFKYEWPPKPWNPIRPHHWPSHLAWPPEKPAGWPNYISWQQTRPNWWNDSYPWPPTETPTEWQQLPPSWWYSYEPWPPDPNKFNYQELLPLPPRDFHSHDGYQPRYRNRWPSTVILPPPPAPVDLDDVEWDTAIEVDSFSYLHNGERLMISKKQYMNSADVESFRRITKMKNIFRVGLHDGPFFIDGIANYVSIQKNGFYESAFPMEINGLTKSAYGFTLNKYDAVKKIVFNTAANGALLPVREVEQNSIMTRSRLLGTNDPWLIQGAILTNPENIPIIKLEYTVRSIGRFEGKNVYKVEVPRQIYMVPSENQGRLTKFWRVHGRIGGDEYL